jgi:diguanylate cyclase (GGDEF)-like protein
MNNMGIKTRVVLLGTLPALFFAVILAGYAIVKVFSVLDDSLRDRGRTIASQMAPAAEYGVISGNTEILEKLAQQALINEREVKAVMIVDKQGHVLALGGRPIENESLQKVKQDRLREISDKDGIVFVSSIYRSLIQVEDFDVTGEHKTQSGEIVNQVEIGKVYVELSTVGLKALENHLILKLVLIGLLGLLFSGLVAWLIGRDITQPIQEIANAVHKVGEGVFSQTIVENSSGELRVLQKGFNSMSEKLRHAYEHMQEKIMEATAMLRHQAEHDDLTGLYNRREFEARLQHCLSSAQESSLQHVFCYMDLDQFKLVNDTCGHGAGDELLKQISALFANRVRERDILARLGGDEFGLLLENCSLAEANLISDKLLKLTRDYRFVHEDKVFNIGVSIGIVVVNSSFSSVSELIHAADSACYSAKNAGRNQSFLYHHEDAESVQRKTAVKAISGITDEIDDSRFRLYCQPIVPLSLLESQSPRFEILIRKIGAEGEITLPTSFIPSAERYHLMPNIDRWVIRNTFAEYRKLLDANQEQSDYQFSINLSGTSLSDKGFLGYIREQFTIYAIPPSAICFEITETAAIVNLKNTINLFTALHKIGCKFALDDFGSGMSSFMYLKNFEVDYLKIDGTFVKEMHENKIDHAMVRSIHSVAEALSIKTVAEFVENELILTELKAIGVHYGQGMYLGAPVELKKLIETATHTKT